MWIDRDISRAMGQNKDIIQILRGPRQCGKSSLMLHLDPSFKEVSLDDPAMRDLAESDPELFLSQFKNEKLFIDEAQYAPRLFPSLKRRADLYKRENSRSLKTILRLTGSNQILMDRQIKESLAGRASFFDLNTLSVAEILHSRDVSIQDILYMGGWPELYAGSKSKKDVKDFLDNYINSYIEKDIVLSAGIQKRREFLKFIKLLAGRVGCVLDMTSLGNESGVDSKTVKDWISVLETMHILIVVPPFSSNLSKRLTKSPKIYFWDTGLACRLQGWTSATPILTSPQQGPLFENLVCAEIYKLIQNYRLDWSVYHWRSRGGEEIDFLIQMGLDQYLFVEAKISSQKTGPVDSFSEVKKVFKKNIPQKIVCHQEGSRILVDQVPIRKLKERLLSA